jgi:hypothetical protein
MSIRFGFNLAVQIGRYVSQCSVSHVSQMINSEVAVTLKQIFSHINFAHYSCFILV